MGVYDKKSKPAEQPKTKEFVLITDKENLLRLTPTVKKFEIYIISTSLLWESSAYKALIRAPNSWNRKELALLLDCEEKSLEPVAAVN